MRRIVYFFLLALLAFPVLPAASDPPEDTKQTVVLRPELAAFSGQCFQAPSAGTFNVVKGWLIEIDFAYLPVPDCYPFPTATCTTTGNGVLRRSFLGVRWHIINGLDGSPAITAYFFKAMKSGQDTITLAVDDMQFSYVINVQD